MPVSIHLAHHGWELRFPEANLSEDRPVAPDDLQRLRAWADRYMEAVEKGSQHAALLAIGQELYAWLNGATAFLVRAVDSVTAPLFIDLTATRQNCEQDLAQAFFNAPWELLAEDGQFWALNPGIVYCPLRRIGKAAPPPPPSPNRLGMVFMAAAPRGADNLNYEAEEASILNATRHLNLDLAVEESGMLDLLANRVASETPHVVQISCHGTLKPRPGLLLENELGDPDFIEASKLVLRLAAHQPRLLFLSACETAQADPALSSLARSLVVAGSPAVLGWAAPVFDHEASLFASLLYQRLVAGESLSHALAYARLELSEHEHLPEPPKGGPRSQNWHLARLFLNPTGGGPIATANGPLRHLHHGRAVKTFLDAKDPRTAVAGPLEFVGRRRDIQKVLRAIRATGDQRHAGIFIHGVGRQGKSSLAARVAHRLEHTHDTVVIFGRYDAPFILRTIADRIGSPIVTEIVNRHLPQVEQTHADLFPALTELLQGPFRQTGQGKPILLVIDDFEQAINENDRRTLKPEYFESIRVLLLAFAGAQTESALLFTSRYQFTCPHNAHDLANRLLDLPLHGMDQHESRKQAGAKLRLQSQDKTKLSKLEPVAQRLDKIIANARGNPGLQDLLFNLAMENPDACDRCLQGMEKYLRGAGLPEQDEIRKFLENLAIQSLLALLTPEHQELLRAATLFELPVPTPVLRKLATSDPDKAIARLLALGLLEVFEDLFNPHVQALAINALVRPQAGPLTEEEQKKLAVVAAPELFAQWGGTIGHKQRPNLLDYELSRLAILANDSRVLAATGAKAMRFLENQFHYIAAARLAEEIISIVDTSKIDASVDLLRTAAHRLTQIGEVAKARKLRERAFTASESDQSANQVDRCALLVDHGRALVREGRLDEAIDHFEQARKLAPSERERAIVLGDIAKLRAAKGEVDQALALHLERLGIFESLGDKRERALTLGFIARLHADKGEIDQALVLHQEKLNVMEALGDKRSRAIALGDIANIHYAKGEVELALQLHQQELTIYEALGDIDSTAVTLSEIAQIEIQNQKWQEAFEHLSESYAINLRLERLDGICFVGLNLGQLLCMAGQREEGLKILLRSRDGFQKLRQTANANQTQALIDQIQKQPPPAQ